MPKKARSPHNQSYNQHKKRNKKPKSYVEKHNNATTDSATAGEWQVVETFEAMRLKEDLLKGIEDYGYVKPRAVHQQTIVPMCRKTDVFAKVAEFEPGRISAICIGILQKLDCASPKCQTVVFAASELSSQVIGKAMEQLGAYLKVKVYVCDGSKGDCPDDVHVVVGKAMYVMDEWSPSWEEHIKVVFFDEPAWQSSLEIAYIFKELLPTREIYHVCCFSERESMEVKTFRRVWMKEPVIIRVPHTLELDKGQRRHRVISVTDDKSKLREIINIYERSTKKTSVVFAYSPESVETLIEEMNKHDLEEVLPTTVGMNQKDKDKMTQELLQAEARHLVLITTIEWANDIDLKQVELVVNYDLPHPVLEDYLHRMCRFGVEVDAINLVTRDEWFILFDIQQQYKNEVIFEAFYPDLIGPAGFSCSPVEGLEISEDKLSPGIKHILYNVSTDTSKLSNIYEYLKEDLVKVKTVIFAKVDHSAVLKREGFNVHRMDDLKGFFQCEEDYCILLITKDKDALNYTHPKVPVVINYDLPLAPDIYNHRVAWCKTNGITMHFVTENDWLKVFHFQRPQSESIIGWPPSRVADFSDMIRRAWRGSSYTYDWESQSESESDKSSCTYDCESQSDLDKSWQGDHWRGYVGINEERLV